MKFILLTIFMLQLAWATDPQADDISDQYTAGPFLIYNCQQQHWVCVMESHYQECQELREADKKTKSFHHRCAAVGEFPTKKSCFQRVLYLTSNDYGARFCIKDEWKDKSL